MSVFLNSSPSNIVHLGAGACSELKEYIALKAKRIILVEADPIVFRLLQQKVRDKPNVQVANTAVADIQSKTSLFRYNFSGANSLREVTGLKKNLPGLKLSSKVSVATVKASDLIKSLKLEIEQPGFLIVDTPGEELAILNELHDSGCLSWFNLLKVYCGISSHYRDSATAKTVLERVAGWGYEIVREDSETEPDRPCWTLSLNPLFRELAAVKETLAEKEQAQISYEEKVKKLSNELQQALQSNSDNAKLLRLRENDLIELQKRFKQSMASQQEQQHLLEQIAERLKVASESLHKLQSEEVQVNK